jgi:hypothetical protein
MRVSGEGATFANNVILIGNLDPGGFFTLDATVFPEVPGPLELLVTVDYTDDFNQQRTITDTVTVEVIEAPPIDPGVDGGVDGGPIEPPPVEEGWWQRLVRFIRALLGLDTGDSAPGGGPDGVPTEDAIPIDGGAVGPKG